MKRSSSFKRVILLGPPGCGKGTQSVWLKGEANFVHLSTGELLRQAAIEGTPVGKEAEQLMGQGHLVPDDTVLALVEERLRTLALDPTVRGFILDGFPRTLGQAMGLSRLLTKQGAMLDAVIYFDCPDSVLQDRICGRRIHPASGRTYHVVYCPPKVADVDDLTGEPLVQRTDDNEDVLPTRLSTYKTTTEPLIKYYAELNLLHKVAADKPAADVRAEVEKILMLSPF